jgi:1-acyl-sn-glycerol-3-phosphate acyltransferase
VVARNCSRHEHAKPSAAGAAALAAGELVGIFPEGRITADGEMNPFRPGITRILERNPVPVVPLALRGLWGSFFSRKDAAAMRRPLPRGVLSRIGLLAGSHALAPASRSRRIAQRLALKPMSAGKICP